MPSKEDGERSSNRCPAVFLTKREMFTRLQTQRTQNSPKRSPTLRTLSQNIAQFHRRPHAFQVTSNAKQICGTIDFGWETAEDWRTEYHSSPIVTVRSVYHACTLSREQEKRKNQTPNAVTVFANSRNCGDHSACSESLLN